MRRDAIIILAAVIAGLAPASGATTYTLTDLGTLDGQYSRALGINELGQVTGVAGTAAGREHAFLWDNGVMADLGVCPGDVQSAGMAINASGQVAGYSGYEIIDPWTYEIISVSTAVLWTGGVPQSLGTLGGTESQAWGVNDSATVVGWSRTSSPAIHPFVWSSGVMTDIGTLGGPNGHAYAVNESGQVAGSSSYCANHGHPFIWESGVMTDLGTFGGPNGAAYALNDSGQVVGYADYADLRGHAFLWDSGVMTDLGALSSDTSVAYGVNNLAQVVGYSGTPTEGMEGFIWENGLMYDLNTLLDGPSPWHIEYAFSINDSGQIVGYGTNGSAYHGLLLNPVSAVPAPGALILGMIGVGVVTLTRKLGERRGA